MNESYTLLGGGQIKEALALTVNLWQILLNWALPIVPISCTVSHGNKRFVRIMSTKSFDGWSCIIPCCLKLDTRTPIDLLLPKLDWSLVTCFAFRLWLVNLPNAETLISTALSTQTASGGASSAIACSTWVHRLTPQKDRIKNSLCPDHFLSLSLIFSWCDHVPGLYGTGYSMLSQNNQMIKSIKPSIIRKGRDDGDEEPNWLLESFWRLEEIWKTSFIEDFPGPSLGGGSISSFTASIKNHSTSRLTLIAAVKSNCDFAFTCTTNQSNVLSKEV